MRRHPYKKQSLDRCHSRTHQKTHEKTSFKPPLKLPRGPVMCGVESLTLTENDLRRLSHPLVGGVILFARNVKSRHQLRALCDHIHAIRTPPLVIGIDQEGGRVQRLRAPRFKTLPPMGSIRKRHSEKNKACLAAFRLGRRLAAELIDLSIDFSFAPVLDIDYGKSAVIGNRSFGEDFHVVSLLAGGFCRGLRSFGVATVGKHFPGHGFVEADSHTEMPEDTRDFFDISLDMAPYLVISDHLTSVMMAHVRYPNHDKMPAGFSSFWINDVLRGKLKFTGLVFSDDLGMVGAHSVGDWVARANAAFIAGCDVVLACNEFDAIDDLLTRWKPVYSEDRFNMLQKRWSQMTKRSS
ncbi:MAG: beta-N-acetylhexosaminidase [Burkholderiales bacterium]|jgi:beta-N-acetylhexosaminidase|nr:beta-N-acetylhexosaminidase [Burkholderiales bacterium]